MGWTYTNTNLSRKEAVDELFTWYSEKYKTVVLKSTMKGAIYYGAVEQINKETGESSVGGVVVLTSSDRKNGFNFGYKIVDETMGPCNCDCPKAILDLLSDTNDEYALSWRKRCRENLTRPKLSNLPLGTKIKVKTFNGDVILTKYPPCAQFRTPVWINETNRTYIPKKLIKNFEVL